MGDDRNPTQEKKDTMSQAAFIASSGILAVANILLIILVLMHRGKGGGLSSMFGGGFTTTAASSAYAEKNLNRATVATAAVWAASIVAVGLLIPYV
jgi:preprotein translocase subunit SecG